MNDRSSYSKAETNTHKYRAYFPAGNDVLPVGIIMLSKEKRIKTINKTAIEILNLDPSVQWVGENISDVF
jgi:nitrogen fixation/metabolism regulation signal transduction histidine kinase